MLYTAFIDLGIQPGVYMGLRTINQPITAGERAFMTACIKKSVTEGNTPVRIRHFGDNKKRDESQAGA